MEALRYIPGEWGNFNAVGSRGERIGLVGHDSGQVMIWLAAHPEFTGSIWFDYGDGGGDVDVTEIMVEAAAEHAAGFVGSTRITQEKAA